MHHKKEHHKDKVNICWNFSSGNCEFGDSLCRFLHSGGSERTKKEIKCHLCEKVFRNEPDFMQHKKSEHAERVQLCTNLNSCSYENCWFRHELCHEQNDEKQEVTDEILRKFTIEQINKFN